MTKNDEVVSVEKIQDAIDISSVNSEFLAASVVIYKTLKINKIFALKCMQELAIRREAGDMFKYEDFIDEEVKKIPVPQNLDSLKTAKMFIENTKGKSFNSKIK